MSQSSFAGENGERHSDVVGARLASLDEDSTDLAVMVTFRTNMVLLSGSNTSKDLRTDKRLFPVHIHVDIGKDGQNSS